MSEGIDIPESKDRRLNRMVATTVVALSVVMAVGKIKDDNICQAMQADQASKIDLWGRVPIDPDQGPRPADRRPPARPRARRRRGRGAGREGSRTLQG